MAAWRCRTTEEGPKLIEAEYEEIDAAEVERAVKRAKLGKLEQDQPDSHSA